MNRSALARKDVSWIGGLLALTLVVAGCGSDGDGAAPDINPPEITSGPTVSQITESSATVSWTTNEASTVAVRYGTSPSIGTAVDAQLALGPATPTTTHSITIEGLDPVTLYHFRAECTDANGNPVYSDESQFTTDLTAEMYLADAWDAFAAQDYVSALASFGGAQVRNPTGAEARIGEGWCDFYLEDYAGSVLAFGSALALDAASLDALAGRAFAYSASGGWSLAEEDAQAVLDENASYVFARDEGFDYFDLHSIIALAAFEQDDFAGAQAQVDFIAPGNTLNPAADDYTDRLSAEVNRYYAQHLFGIGTQGHHPGIEEIGLNP